MQIDRVIFPVEALGPGKRLAIWTVGCRKHCRNCSNKELWDANPEKDIRTEALMAAISDSLGKQLIEGITITGGDPLEQHGELLDLLGGLKMLSDDILLYTGYTHQEIKSFLSVEEYAKLAALVSVLIDGQYDDNLNDNNTVLKGSSNQNIIYFDKSAGPKYEKYLAEGRKIQNIYCGDRIVSVGIHNRER